MTASACARISLSAIQHNLESLHSYLPTSRVLAVVKGNAYGHGLLPVARALASADGLAVARLSEARQLRESGLTHPLLLLSGVIQQRDLHEAAALELALVVHNDSQIDWLDAYSGPRFSVWPKIDTGMHRLGFSVQDASRTIARLQASAAVNKITLMTHFGNAENPADGTTLRQLDLFQRVIADCEHDFSIANSAGIIGFADALQNFAATQSGRTMWIRPGISLYGISPLVGHAGADYGLLPAMSFGSRLVSVRALKSGARVGYGGDWQAARDTVVGTVAAGYADGYPPAVRAGTPVRINGREVPIVGRISMDLLAVDLGQDAPDAVGDDVILWGEQLSVERVAEKSGIGAYQLVTGVLHREAAVHAD